MANDVGNIGKQLDDLMEKVKAFKAQGLNVDTSAVESQIKNVRAQVVGLGKDGKDSSDTISKGFHAAADELARFTDVVTGSKKLASFVGEVATAILEVGKGAASMGDQFKNAFGTTEAGKAVAAFDDLTEMTRNLRGSAIDVGNTFGMSFDQIRGSYNGYITSILAAQNNTYESRQQIQQHTVDLARMGVGLDELSKTFQVAGAQQSILTEGFLLSADSGLQSDDVFKMMGTSMRKMGLSAEEAGRPLLALENIAKETGLPIQELSSEIFRTAEQGARLGLTVDSMTPIVRRFVDVLGPGFKGLAIDESTKIIRGLEGQINSTNAAFMAMQGGLSRPGAGVAEAQLAFEDAFKNPIEIIKSLQTTIGGVTGGKIIKFEEARANPELSNQFKIQRDLLQQLTGNTDPQSQRTVMGILSDMQSGRQLSAAQNKTLEESLKSGTQKQEEQKSLQDKIGKAQVGLLTQISVNTSAMFERLLPPQAQAGIARMTVEKGIPLEQKGIELFNQATAFGSKMLDKIPGVAGAEKVVGGAYNKAIAAAESTAGTLRPPTNYTIPGIPGAAPASMPFTNARTIEMAGGHAAPIPQQTAPTPFTNAPAHIAPGTHTPPAAAIRTTSTPGEKEPSILTIIFKGTDALTTAIADAASAAYNQTLRGH